MHSRKIIASLFMVMLAAPAAHAQAFTAEWPEVPYDPPVYGNEMPTLPVMHRLNINLDAALDTRSPEHDILMSRLMKILVFADIAPEMAELKKAIWASQVVVSLVPGNLDVGGTFAVVNGMGVLSVNAQLLADIDSEIDVFLGALILAHEVVHFRQWRQGKFEQEREGVLGARARCEERWRIEREAYHRECMILNRYRVRDANTKSRSNSNSDRREQLCDRAATARAFDQSLFYLFAYREIGGTPLSRKCTDIWWKLAGGPSH